MSKYPPNRRNRRVRNTNKRRIVNPIRRLFRKRAATIKHKEHASRQFRKYVRLYVKRFLNRLYGKPFTPER